MPVAFLLPMISQQARALGNNGIADCYHAAFTRRHSAGSGKGKAPCAQTANRLTMDTGRMRLVRILDDNQVMLVSDGLQPLHIARVAIEMHRQYGFCTRRNSRLYQQRINSVSLWVDINKDRLRPYQQNHIGGGSTNK